MLISAIIKLMTLLKKINNHTCNLVLLTCAWAVAFSARAQFNANEPIYGGGGIEEGTEEAGLIVGEETLREKIISILETVLSYMALAAVVVIVIAGIRLVVSQGEDEQKEKAKRTIIYAVVGLLVILLARGLVLVIVNMGES